MTMINEVKKWYIAFIEKDKRNLAEAFAYALLLMLSWVYAVAVAMRNFFYDHNIIPSYSPPVPIISVGNISWAGSGKTSLSIWLYERLCRQRRVCILRRGYGDDENKLLKEKVGSVLSGKDRLTLARQNQKQFELFILDDGFQYRRLRRRLDIVVMSVREFRKPNRLIPAYFFREPFAVLQRADIVVVNHSDEAEDLKAVKQRIIAVNNRCGIYFARYCFSRFVDLDGSECHLDYFLQHPVAAFAAIGYPAGFFRKLRELGLQLRREIIYPDHHALTRREFAELENQLLSEGLTTLLITHKDKFHFPYRSDKISLFVMEVELVIEGEENFLSTIQMKINGKADALSIS